MRNLAIFLLIPLTGLALAGCTNSGAGTRPKGPLPSDYDKKGDYKKPEGKGGAAKLQPIPAKDGKVAFDGSTAKIEFVGTKPEGKHDGGFKEFTGMAELTADGKGLDKIALDITTDSLWADNGKLTEHLKSGDFFDVKRCPKAEFVSTKIEENKKDGATHTITGKLTLHGETKEISIPATVRVENGLALHSSFTIDRTQFGMVFGKGKVNDEVQIKVAVGK